jgi:hypothetical protein
MRTYIEKYSLPFDKSGEIDSSDFYFSYSGFYDTSFLLHLYKEDTSITGTLYEILPNYHRSDDDYSDEQSKLLFFEGYSFKIDSAVWNVIISNARNEFSENVDTPGKNEACNDCPFYLITYDLKIKKSNSGNRVAFTVFAKYLKDSLLNQYIIKRQPKMHKTNN